jgi:drug/metabolite transporter (DMT)-like permease
MHVRNTRSAIAFMAAASLCFAVMGALVKASTDHLPFLVAVVFRNVIGALPLVVYFLARGVRFRSRRPGLLFFRSASGFTAMFLFFLAIEYLPLSTATILNSSSPVFVVLLAGLVLREQRIGALLPLVVVAVGGVAWLVLGGPAPPGSDGAGRHSVGIAVLGLLSAVFAAMAYLSVRRLSRTEPSARIVLHFALWSSAFSVAVLAVAVATGLADLDPAQIVRVLSGPREAALLVGVGLAGLGGQMCMTSAYARERASVISGFSYLNPLFAYIIGVSVFGEPVTWAGIGGGTLVLGASLGLARVAEQPDPGVSEPGRSR